MIIGAKIATLIAWIAILINWITPLGDAYTLLHYTGIGLASAHAIEMLVFLPKARKARGNTLLHLLQLFIFGYAHNMALDAEAAQ